ncbi:MAG: DUF488 domain-containing protein [Candidatus Thermoplasmatota archaeon]|nr:DUF488 domain-containing protein [Candidatus Thermoplasmatota archaeon]MBS3789598.1 DUF488 domain-containing protein [Candidatus Thermoplasmatota archaeon]
MNKVYTIGYEGKEIEEFIQLLEKYGVNQVVDVRSYPTSKRKKFKKNNLRQELFKASIKYRHLPRLGGLRDKDYQETMKEDEWLSAFEELKDLAEEKKTVILCLESNPMKCHRRFIAEELEKEGWEVVHIGEGGSWKEKKLNDF